MLPDNCMRKQTLYFISISLGCVLNFLFTATSLFAQNLSSAHSNHIQVATTRFSTTTSDLFGTKKCFIKNIGQYGSILSEQPGMGKILYAYEGLGMPVLFTPKGIIHLQRKIEGASEEEKEKKEARERKGSRHRIAEDEIEQQRAVDQLITMEWLNANPEVNIIAEEPSAAYHTYASFQGKAFGYRKIIYKNLYPNIDLVYSFNTTDREGYEYSLIVKSGADLSTVRMKFGGDLKKIKTDATGNLIISSEIDAITETLPVSFYGNDVVSRTTGDLKLFYKVNNNEISFSLPQNYDRSRPLVIDPFITSTTSLSGLNAGKAKDVDFDYNGNIYVTGGGNPTVHQLAKYNSVGVLQWTFSGSLTIPSWSFGTYWGGWMVEKPTGNIYLGQGFNPATGFQVIRVSTTGLYDNYITNANPNFREAWKMYWSCNNGSPQILVAGGGTNSNINFGVFTSPSASISALNVTGIPYSVTTGWAQDIVDFIIDPVSYDMYTLYGSLIGTPSLTNKIYKNTTPYSGASVAWNVPSGFTTVQEIANRPYLLGGQIDNSANIFAINASYLYYWDGKNLKAFDKATGVGVGTPLITANTALMQGGIIADACNNVFVGDGNGVIKVYQFNGNSFDDLAAPDINIAGFAGKAVYDLAYDESKKLLYASGDGFVASFDVSPYCPSTQYSLTATPDCINSSVAISVNPTPPSGSTITYVLYNGTTQIASNTTGLFTNLQPNTNYTVVATINLACSGTQTTTSFTLPGPTITIAQTNASCGINSGSIAANGSGGTPAYSYSIDGVNFQSGGSFNGLAGGIYTITVKDMNGCKSTRTVTLLNSNGPQLTFTSTNAACGNNNATITASVNGGTAPYQYSINGGSYQGNNFFTGLTAGNYTLTVKDAGGCTNSLVVTITSSSAPSITAIPAAATCGSGNGTITAFGQGGAAPLQYSINGNTFQSGNVFTNLTPGSYTVTVKDVNGCIQTTGVAIDNSPAPTVTATSAPASCNNINGTITANGNGGIAPLQYSINGITYQTGNIFTGLAAGSYTVYVKDNTGCTNLVTVGVSSTGGPALTASSTSTACNTSSGTITASASGGTPGYQYSINGISFQVANTFSGLAAGNYVVYVKDLNSCIGTATITVGNSGGPSIIATVSPTECNSNTGVITASGSGGVSPLLYSIDGTNYQSGNVFSALATDTYTVYVKDANGCIKTTTAVLLNTSGLSLNVSSISSSCNINNGSITATATGGIAPLQYSINGATYQTGNIFSGLTTGTYPVYVKDANGCVVTKQTTVTAASGPSLSLSVLQNASCASANGVIKAIASGGVSPLTYSIDGGSFQTATIFINVVAGTHSLLVKDASGCTSSQTITITNSGAGTSPGDLTFVLKDALPCTGGTGRIKNLKGVPGGGSNRYTFSLDGGAFTTANQFTNVSPGLHVITAINETGCTISKLVTIGSSAPATATAAVTATTCNGSTGTITLTGVGVNTPYHASIDNGVTWVTFNSTFTFTALAAGTYPIKIADDADFTTGPPDIPGACITTIYIAVPSTGGPSLSTSQINPTCASNLGSITATGSGGTAPYSYSINGGAYFSSGVFNNLTAGNYAVTVKDATGCTTGANITLTNPSAPVASAIVEATSCNSNNGSITANATGGIAPLEYSINGTTFQSSNSFTGLPAGSYTLYVKDANGCYTTLAVSIANTSLPKISAFTIAASCNNSDGSIVATGSGGTTPYSFSIDGTVYQSSNTFNNLSAGFYTVYIKDVKGCSTTTGVSVGNATGPSITNISTTAAACNNANGSLLITAIGGIAPLQYSIDGIRFQSSNSFNSLISGAYTVYVKDANGCLNTRTVTVSNTAGPQTLTASIVNSSCNGNDGSITTTASGGVAPLQYSIDGINYQSATGFINLAAGNYTLYVKDANGCIKTVPVILLNLIGPSVTASSSSASCGSGDGTITATASGGTGVLSYSLDGVNFQPGNIFINLSAGAYTVYVKDQRGCIGNTSVTVTTVGATITPLFAPVAPVCSGEFLAPLPATSLNGITGTWSPALNNTATTTYTFTPSAGQCAGATTLTITAHPKPLPLIIYHN
jgi:SprB repeat